MGQKCRGTRFLRGCRVACGRSIRAALAGAIVAAIAGAVAGPAAAAAPAPTSLRLVPEVESLNVHWGVVGDTKELRGFRIRWRPLSGGSQSWSSPVVRPASARFMKIGGLASEPYRVRVRALLTGGALGAWTTAIAKPHAAPVEEPPTEEPPKEEPPKEEPPKEEPPGEEHEGGGGVVSRAPVGPPAPASGWHVDYADGFGAPLGSGPGHDNTLQSDEKWNGCCTNSDEVAIEQHKQVRVGKEGLEEICSIGLFTVEGHTRGASCGGVRGDSFFEFTPAAAGEWAVECDVRMPVDVGGADPGCWTYPSASGEIDFFELWGWDGLSWSSANAGMPVLVGQGAHELSPVDSLGFDPSAGFHRYTTAFVPEGSGRYDVREYIDGVYRWDMAGQTLSKSSDGLILTNGLRILVQPDVFTVRSIALWQDGAHAGQGVKGGGVAPGTTIAP